MKDLDYIKLAHKEAKKSKMHHKIGAILVSGKTTVSKAHNRLLGVESYKMNGFTINWSIHAEVDALRKALHAIHNDSNDGMSLDLYVARKGYRLARPCPACMKIIEKFNIHRIIYSNGYREIGEIYL